MSYPFPIKVILSGDTGVPEGESMGYPFPVKVILVGDTGVIDSWTVEDEADMPSEADLIASLEQDLILSGWMWDCDALKWVK